MHEPHKKNPHSPSAVLLVDNKRRDLMGAALIALHLNQQGVQCYLEPLEAYQGVLAAYHPSLILFNHLTVGHLVNYSQRLAKLGVLTAVLPNEGILYDRHVLDFNAGKHHNGAHIDLFFCWNQAHKDALQKSGFTHTQIEVVGVPRFDFYFPPWSGLFPPARPAPAARPRILFCTNFVFAKCKPLPRVQIENVFGQWKMIPGYQNYLELIDANYRSRSRVFPFLKALAAAGKYEIILRPHPSEDIAIHREWLDQLPAEERQRVTLDPDTLITELILGCDLEISCETCTTALESWIARKPTIELLLEKHPVFFHADIAGMTATCDTPADLVSLVEKQLAQPASAPAPWEEARRRHLQAWCHSPEGNSSLKIAQVMATRLARASEPDWSQLRLSDHRRAFKLKLMRTFGQAYHFDPFLPLKHRLAKGRYTLKARAYAKSILPGDVRAARKILAGVTAGQAR